MSAVRVCSLGQITQVLRGRRTIPAEHVSGPLPFDPIAEATRHWRDRGWTDAAPGMAAVTSIMRAQQIVQARVDAQLKPLG